MEFAASENRRASQSAEHIRAAVGAVLRRLRESQTRSLTDVARAAEIYEQLALELCPRTDTVAVARHSDPRIQLELASRALPPRALQSLADFTLYLASTHAGAGRRRIGFTFHD